MRKVFAIMLVVAPLIAACGKAEEPLIPELKGRWDLLSLAKMRADRLARMQTDRTVDMSTVGMSNASQPDTSDNCDISYVTFSKQRIATRTSGIPIPAFQVADVKREGERVIIAGGTDSNPATHGQLVLLLRNGEVRFDDIIDESGRSVKHERLPHGHPLRSKGATTLGEGLRVFLDLRPCKA